MRNRFIGDTSVGKDSNGSIAILMGTTTGKLRPNAVGLGLGSIGINKSTRAATTLNTAFGVSGTLHLNVS